MMILSLFVHKDLQMRRIGQSKRLIHLIDLSPNLCAFFFSPSVRELEFTQREDAEKKKLEEVERNHLAEIQSLQVRVIIHRCIS